MPSISTTCHGIGFTRFPAGANLLLVTCPALVLQAIMSIAAHESDETQVADQLRDILIPLLDAVEAHPRHGVMRGRAAETARRTQSEALPWTWEGRVRIERPDEPVIDSAAMLSAVTSSNPPNAEGAAFARAHPWLTCAIIEAEDRAWLMESLTDQALQAQAQALCPHQLADLLKGAGPEQGAAYVRATQRRDEGARMRLLAEMLRTRLTRPRFPTLALALPDTHDRLAFLTRLTDAVVEGLLRDTAKALVPS